MAKEERKAKKQVAKRRDVVDLGQRESMFPGLAMKNTAMVKLDEDYSAAPSL